jgi:predicted nucleic acid-binding protein
MSNRQELLFDTNCLIDIYWGRERIRPTFDSILAGEVTPYMSVITEAELWRGLRAGELEKHQALVTQFTILPLRSEAARLAGSWMQQYQAAGLGWMDALITATAQVNDLVVLTRDKNLAQLLAREADFTLYT